MNLKDILVSKIVSKNTFKRCFKQKNRKQDCEVSRSFRTKDICICETKYFHTFAFKTFQKPYT